MLNLLLALAPMQTQSPEARATALVSQMTVDEKIGQLMMESPAIPRLGIPRYHWWSEALHGVAFNGVATVFPQAIGLAATWNPNLMHDVATAISIEARAKNNQDPGPWYHGLTLWSPNINIFRDPRWGRGQETYGEDPFLTSRMGVAFVTGIQGDDPNVLRCVATPKHFAVHSGPEPLRHEFDATAPERDLYETYFPAFEACVREGQAQSVMSAYSGFNNQYCTGSPWLLTTLLRDKWGFKGAVVSDVDSVKDLFVGHHVAKDDAEASAMALKAGDDLNSGYTYRALPDALKRGLVTEKDLDRAAIRLFTLRYKLGMFDKHPYQQIPATEIDSPTHDELNLKTAKESLVLLKNDGVLPLKPSVKRIAVVGPTANDVATLIGNYPGVPSHPVTILDGLRKRGVRVDYAYGSALAEGLDVGREPFPRGTVTFDASFLDGSNTTPGFKKEVFRGRNFDQLISTGASPSIDYAWMPPNHPTDIPLAEDVSIRWTATFNPPATGEATFGISADDGMRLYVDDKLVVDDWREDAERGHKAKVAVTKGKPVQLRVEFYQAKQGAAIHFGYSMPNSHAAQDEALETAKDADVIVLALGITPNLEGEEMTVNATGFKGGDRTAIELPKPQLELWEAVRKLGKPVVVVLTGGSAIAFDPAGANAVLDQWYSGGRGGDAVASALFGDFSPAGRLPVTFYRSTKDLPAFESYAMAGRTYRYFAGKPLFPFGYGLSYTRFRYGKPLVKPIGSVWRVQMPLTNVGGFDGDEVVQVYAHPKVRLPGDARHELVGFARVSVAKGETRPVNLSIDQSRLRVWDTEKQAYVVRPGEYELEIGASSADIRTRLKVKVGGE